MLFEGLITLCGSWRGSLSFALLLCAKLMSASFEYSRGELCDVDQLLTPPTLVIMSASISCASTKVSAVATMEALSVMVDESPREEEGSEDENKEKEEENEVCHL